MSQIIKVIKRIGIVAKKRNRKNLPATSIGYFPPYESVRDVTPENLTPKQLKLVNQYLGNYQPRLNLEQIEEIIKLYRFQLSREFYDLYLMDNGCLPIGILQENELNSVYNYCYFPDYPARFSTL